MDKKEPKVRVTINIDKRVVDYFKDRAMREDRQYQLMINRVLCDYVDRDLDLQNSRQRPDE